MTEKLQLANLECYKLLSLTLQFFYREETLMHFAEVDGSVFDNHEPSMYSYNEKSMPRKENPKNSPRFPPIALTKPEKSINRASVKVDTSEVV